MMRFLLLLFLSTAILSYGQNRKQSKKILTATGYTYRDTIYNIAFDSLCHNLGNISSNEETYLVKYFKYIGTAPVSIARTWTTDPHFICDYPQGLLVPNKIYSFKVCFNHQGRYGYMFKTMGFDLSDGNRIMFKFSGVYTKVKTNDSLTYQIFNCINNKVVSSKLDMSLHIYGLYISDSIIKEDGPRTTSYSKSVPASQVIYYKPAFYEIDDLSGKIIYKEDTILINALKKYTFLIAVNQYLTVGQQEAMHEENFSPVFDIFRMSTSFSYGHKEGIGGQIYPKVTVKAFPELDAESESWGYTLYYTKEDGSGSTSSKTYSYGSVKIVDIFPDSASEKITQYNTEQIERLGIPYLVWYGHLDDDGLVDLILRYCKTNKDGFCEDEFQLILSSKLKESYRSRVKKSV